MLDQVTDAFWSDVTTALKELRLPAWLESKVRVMPGNTSTSHGQIFVNYNDRGAHAITDSDPDKCATEHSRECGPYSSSVNPPAVKCCAYYSRNCRHDNCMILQLHASGQ
jgi:hypothetical protein